MKPIQDRSARFASCLFAALIPPNASALLLLVSVAVSSTALAQSTYKWTQTAGGDQSWDTGGNWTPVVVPDPVSGDIVDFSTVNILAGTTLTLGADRTAGLWKFGDTTGSTTWTVNSGNKITLAGTTPTIQVNNGSAVLKNEVAGTQGLTKTNGGTLTLEATNSYTGNTTISGGTLNIGSNNTSGSTLGSAGTYAGDISVTTTSSKLIFNTNTSQTLSGLISGDGTLQKAGSGTLTLTGPNTYTGKTTIAATAGGGPTLSVSSLNSVNGGTPLLPSSSLGAPTTVADGTIDLGSGGNQRSATLIYTGPGETTDRAVNVSFNAGAKQTIYASGTGLLKFTSAFTINPSSGTTGGGLTLRGTGSGEIAEIGTIPGIFEKNDAGTWTIHNAVNTTPTTAPVNVNAGALVLRKGGFGHAGATTVSANAALIYNASADAPLLISGPLVITGGTSTTIGASVGSTVNSARIDVAGNATTTAAAVKLNLYGNPSSTAGDGTETYTLIQGGGTNTLNNATWSLGTVFNATNFTVGAINKTSDAVTADITQIPSLTTAFWKGTATTGLTKVWAATNGSTDGNWSTTAGGATQSLVPGAGTDVIIPSTPPAVAPTNTTLGADMSIRSLTIADTTNGLGLGASVEGSYSLTLGTGGVTLNTGVPASAIGVPVVLGGSQTWTNDSANALTVSGPVSGSGTLEKAGVGTVNLTGLNTFAGNVTVTGGTLAFAKPTVPTGAMVRVAAGATLQLGYPGDILVSYLILDGVSKPAGTYSNSNAAPFLTGTGSLTVTTTDTDVDGIPDSWMMEHFGHPTGQAADLSRAGDDADFDDLDNLGEFQQGTNPKVSDTDIDDLSDGAEVHTHLTKPLIPDTDGDGLTDGAEVNTHLTNPLLADTDGDGLSDGDEVNIHTTNPLLADSDSDGAGDWYEIKASFTDPKISTSKPNIPYPLPKPDSTPPATDKPVKVFILMGQSNMQGKGAINPAGTLGTLATVVKQQNKFPNLLDTNGNWSVRSDVKYRGVISCIGNANLTVGQGTGSTQIGPELGFGHVMGYHFDEPVIVIKASFGGQDLGFDFLSPGSQRYNFNGRTYAGYLDTARSWTEGSTPPSQHVPGTPISYLANPNGGAQNYAGKMFDDCVSQVNGILGDFANQYPQYAAQGYQISGIGWFQGWNDSVSTSYPEQYEENMVNFIKAYRSAVNAPDAPFVIASSGFDGQNAANGQLAVINAQLAVPNRTEFVGNVKTMDTRSYWRTVAESPVSEGYHYNHNSETYTLVGDAIARGMIDLLGSDYETWAGIYSPADLSDPNADYDKDGMTNDAERAFGLNPTSGSSVNPISVPLDAAAGTLTYTRRNPALTGLGYSYQWSETLAAGGWTTFTPAGEAPSGASPVESVSLTLGSGLLAKPKLFVRIVAAPN